MKINPPVQTTVKSYDGEQPINVGDIGFIDEVVVGYDWPLHVTFTETEDWFESSELIYLATGGMMK